MNKAEIYKTLNECTSILNTDVSTGQVNVYVTIDRRRYNALLKAITEAKKILVRPPNELVDG
jgi:hypothetical protein